MGLLQYCIVLALGHPGLEYALYGYACRHVLDCLGCVKFLWLALLVPTKVELLFFIFFIFFYFFYFSFTEQGRGARSGQESPMGLPRVV